MSDVLLVLCNKYKEDDYYEFNCIDEAKEFAESEFNDEYDIKKMCSIYKKESSFFVGRREEEPE